MMNVNKLTAAFAAPKTDAALKRDDKGDLAVGRDTLRLEADALNKLADGLDARFTQAVDVILNHKGRVILTGIGKPGHVAKKIAATLASTGTPSSYVHPAEASHGDLGMITDQDVVLALSKSGESQELRDIVNYCKRFSVTLIAITMKPESTLGRQADLILQLPDVPEACPNQQAPTTSTTMIIGLGDALAMALMQRRGFSATDFRQYHPGGKLGGQLITVQSVMQQGDALPLVRDNAVMRDVQNVMSAKNFGCAIVVDTNGTLAGFISDGDIRRHLSADLLDKPVTHIMGKHPRTIDGTALTAAALAIMNQHNITQLVVTDNDKPIGLLRLHDIMRAGVA